MSESPQQEQLTQDLGLVDKLSERSRARLLNRDDTFNVRRNDLSPFHPYNAITLFSLFQAPAARPDGCRLLRHQPRVRIPVLACRPRCTLRCRPHPGVSLALYLFPITKFECTIFTPVTLPASSLAVSAWA